MGNFDFNNPQPVVLDYNAPKPDNFHGLQYINFLKAIKNHGEMLPNERTGIRCLTNINANMIYILDFKQESENVFSWTLPLDTTRKSFWRSAVAEMLGYIRGYDNAADFRELGTKTWDANANENEAWLANAFRKGDDDMGRVYGVQGRSWAKPDGGSVDQLAKIINDLANGKDDRGEILNFYNPGEFHMGCLRPCMYSHQFSLINGKLFLNSSQRSDDSLLGHNFNQVQVASLLGMVGAVTKQTPVAGFHNCVNIHMYENQLEVLEESGHLDRVPRPDPRIILDLSSPRLQGLSPMEVLESLTPDDFQVVGYDPHPAIKYPFAV